MKLNFDLSNPDHIPFGQMPKEAQWAMEGALEAGEELEFFSTCLNYWKPAIGSFYHRNIYRLRPEPETVTLHGVLYEGGVCVFSNSQLLDDTHILALPVQDGQPIPGEYTSPDGNTAVIAEIGGGDA